MGRRLGHLRSIVPPIAQLLIIQIWEGSPATLISRIGPLLDKVTISVEPFGSATPEGDLVIPRDHLNWPRHTQMLRLAHVFSHLSMSPRHNFFICVYIVVGSGSHKEIF